MTCIPCAIDANKLWLHQRETLKAGWCNKTPKSKWFCVRRAIRGTGVVLCSDTVYEDMHSKCFCQHQIIISLHIWVRFCILHKNNWDATLVWCLGSDMLSPQLQNLCIKCLLPGNSFSRQQACTQRHPHFGNTGWHLNRSRCKVFNQAVLNAGFFGEPCFNSLVYEMISKTTPLILWRICSHPPLFKPISLSFSPGSTSTQHNQVICYQSPALSSQNLSFNCQWSPKLLERSHTYIF